LTTNHLPSFCGALRNNLTISRRRNNKRSETM